MAIYSNTLDTLVEKVCRLCGDWLEGTTTASGTTATLIDTNRYEADDYFNSLPYCELYLRGGTYSGTSRYTISDWVNSTGTLTFSPVLAGAPGSGVSYSIHREWPRQQVVDMINLAIDMVAEEALVWHKDETSLTLSAGTYEYAVPSNFMVIHRITMADEDDNFDDQDPIPPDQYRIVHGNTPLIRFNMMPDYAQADKTYYGGLWASDGLVASRILRVEGLASPDTLSSDSDTCSISPAYVVFQAAALLHGAKTRATEHDPDAHMAQSLQWQKRADVERGKVVDMQFPPNAKRVRE